jgi:hypothetical protein
MDEFCAHRGVSLWFGRNEDSGLRCPYHGWKYDVTGQCVEVPSEPVESGFLQEDQARRLLLHRTWRHDLGLYGASFGKTAASEFRMGEGSGGIHVKLLPGSFRPVVNKDNDYMIDRLAQKHHKSYSGVKGIAMQDAAIQESTGPIQDRSKENLVSTDNGVIMERQRLRKAALGLMQGHIPDSIEPATHAVRSAAIVLPEAASFYDAAGDSLVAKAGVAHASV